MPVKFRPANLGSGIDEDRPDYHLQRRLGCQPHVRNPRRSKQSALFWSTTVGGPMTRSNRVATLEEANAQFQRSWDACKAWAELDEVPVVVGYQTTSALGMPVGIHLRAGWTVVPGSCALLF
jgi:hypothetical protein